MRPLLLLALVTVAGLRDPAGSLAIMLLLLAGSAFYSGAETAFVSARRARIEALAQQGHRDAIRAVALLESAPRTLTTVLVGTNLCNIGLTSYVTAIAVAVSPEHGPVLATVVLTPIVLFFAEILPKLFFRARATRLLRLSAGVLRASQLVFAPLVSLSSRVAQLLLRMVGVPGDEGRPAFRRGDLETVFLFGGRRHEDDPGEATRTHDEALRMAGRALVLHERTASEAMVPLAAERTVPADGRVADAVARFRDVGGAYLAVVGPGGGVEGFLDAKTLLDEPPGAPLPVRPAWSLDPDEPLDEVIQGLRRHQQSIGLVRSREGQTLGVVTAEDVFEELVGELTEGGSTPPPAGRR